MASRSTSSRTGTALRNRVRSVCAICVWALCLSACTGPQPDEPAAVLRDAPATAPVSDDAAISREQLIGQPPLGWQQSGATSIAGIRTAQFVPEGDDESDWTRRIRFESLSERPLPDPIEFIEILTMGQDQLCGTYEAFPTFAGNENGYSTAVYLLVCHHNRDTNRSEVTLIKTIQGNDYFYIISRARRGPPIKEDEPAIPEEEIAAWSVYLKSISVCDATPEHPCPEAAAS